MPLPTAPDTAGTPQIPFNQPSLAGKELFYISQAVHNKHLAGDGHFTRLCTNWFEHHLDAHKVLLTTSCTTALEIAAALTDIQPGDEVILPSYTHAATANAFLRRGAVLIFTDIRKDTLNMDESLIEKAITSRTKAIVPVHYAGVACEMNSIMSIADTHKLVVIEDAAQAINARYKKKPLGTIGHLGAYSFHETKNISSGEGGALILNDPSFVERAETIRDQGTSRAKFLRGETEEYCWIGEGFAATPSEITAAFLYGQLEQTAAITKKRLQLCRYYHKQLAPLSTDRQLTLPTYPQGCRHNGHMFYLLTRNSDHRNKLLHHLRKKNIQAVSHYVPLHNSPRGNILSQRKTVLPVTESMSGRLLRLPLHYNLSRDDQERVTAAVLSYFTG